MYFAGLPTVIGTRTYDWYAFSLMYPGWTSVPINCVLKGLQNPPPPPPQPPVDDPDPPPGPVTGPITGDPPPAECGTGPGLIKDDDRTTSSSWWNSGGGKGAGGTDGHGPYDQLAQPVVVGMTPLGVYSSKKPVYTKQPYFQIRTGDKHAIMDAYHEGTGQGMLVLHAPELMDYHLYGPGQITGLANKWPTTLSTSSLILFNSTRPDSSTGDTPTMYLGFGRVVEASVTPALGHYFSLNLSTYEFILATTDSLGADVDNGTFTLKQMALNLGQSPTAGLGLYVGAAAGAIIWDSDAEVIKYYTGADWANVGLLTPDGDFTVPGKLTVGGLIDPTGLELTPVAANPGGTAANTLWLDSGDSNRLKHGAQLVGEINGTPTNGNLLSWNSGSKRIEDSGSAASDFAAAAHSHADYLEIANDLSDLASDDTAIANLLTGATARTPALDSYIGTYKTSGGQSDPQTILALGALVFEARLSPSSTLAVPTSDSSSVTTLYLHPYKGNRVALYDTGNSRWYLAHMSAAVSKALSGLTASRPYDVFLYSSAGTLTLEFVAWTSGTARATALTTQDGVLVKSGDASRRYVGTFYATGATTTAWVTDGSTTTSAKLFIWNYYNRVNVTGRSREGTASWTYGTSTWRSMNNDTANRVEVVIGVQEDHVDVQAVLCTHQSNTTGAGAIGEDSTSAVATGCLYQGGYSASNTSQPFVSHLRTMTAIGYHYYQAIEISTFGTGTFYGANTSPNTQSGIALLGRF